MPWPLSIVIPAYNEGMRIGRSLDEILAFVTAHSYSVEVIVVDDGSTDDTADQVESRVAAYERAGHLLRLLTNSPNRGKGYSIKRGMTEAAGDIVLFSDADFSSPITEAPALIIPIAEGRADVTFGSRAIDRSLIGIRQAPLRDFGGRVFNFLMRAITGLNFKDTQCGFKAFRRKLAAPVFRLQRIERFGFDPEILYIARKRGLRLLEVPVRWDHSEGSKVSFFRDSLTMFLDLLRIRINDLNGRYDSTSGVEGEEEPVQANSA
jgi:glycosyltransferase involved in cell wall biosynthesis